MAANVNSYVSAGNAAVRKAVMARKALAENKPRYDEIAMQAVTEAAKDTANIAKNNSLASQTAMNAKGLMERTNIELDKDKFIRGQEKKARMTGLLAGGVAIAGIGANMMNKKPEENELLSSYQSMLAQQSSQINSLNQQIADGEAAYSNMPTSVDKPTSDSKTDDPGKVDGGDAAPQPKLSAGSGDANSFKGVYDMAVKSGAKFPELVAAQWALESANGTAISGTNNYFGIKATSNEASTSKPTWEVVNGQRVNTSANFKDFDTPQASVDDLVSKWYKDYKGYSGVNRAGSASEAAGLLLAENYATDPKYADKLRDIMRRNGY